MILCSLMKLKILFGCSQIGIKKRARKRQNREAIPEKVKRCMLMTTSSQKSTILLMYHLKEAKIGKLLAMERSIQVIRRILE